jgi:hypothetical protein
VSERPNEAVSKTVRRHVRLEGSNPSLSATLLLHKNPIQPFTGTLRGGVA